MPPTFIHPAAPPLTAPPPFCILLPPTCPYHPHHPHTTLGRRFAVSSRTAGFPSHTPPHTGVPACPTLPTHLGFVAGAIVPCTHHTFGAKSTFLPTFLPTGGTHLSMTLTPPCRSRMVRSYAWFLRSLLRVRVLTTRDGLRATLYAATPHCFPRALDSVRGAY